MSLFLPTATTETTPAAYALAKGELYNLDRNEMFQFQFNPQNFIWERQLNWATANFKGASNGGHPQFLNLDAREFDLTLLFVADPSAPLMNYYADENIVTLDESKIIDFEALIRLILAWEKPIDGLGRPGILKLVMGANNIDCIIDHYQVHEQDYFEDMTVKAGQITFSMKEWVQ